MLGMLAACPSSPRGPRESLGADLRDGDLPSPRRPRCAQCRSLLDLRQSLGLAAKDFESAGLCALNVAGSSPLRWSEPNAGAGFTYCGVTFQTYGGAQSGWYAYHEGTRSLHRGERRGCWQLGGMGGLNASLTLAALVALIGFSTLVHEAGHALAAVACGWKVQGMILHPLGVAVKIEVGERRSDVWKVALGGLVATAWLSFAFLALAPLGIWFATGFAVNAGLLLTNMVPIRMLDGGHVLKGLRLARVAR